MVSTATSSPEDPVSAPMTLAVGDVVVYGSHGAGRVTARETRDVRGAREVVIVLALSRGLSVQLPLASAEGLLRPAADEAEMTRVQEVLAAAAEATTGPWLQRRREAQAKLNSTLGLAEILRDGADREEASLPHAQLSPSERDLFRKARDLLTNEIALARGLEPAAASDWIDDQLTSSAS